MKLVPTRPNTLTLLRPFLIGIAGIAALTASSESAAAWRFRSRLAFIAFLWRRRSAQRS